MQLDRLALNLMRIQVLAQSGTDEPVVRHLVRESQFFIEWMVPTMNLETDVGFATELVELQRLFSRWELDGLGLWANEGSRQEIAGLAGQWCDRIQKQGKLQAG